MMTSEFSSRDDKKELLERAMESAIKKLNTRQRTEKEIADFLKEKEYTQEVISTVICQLKELNYVDDAEYCRQYFKYSKKKNKADYRIIKELNQKGIASDLAKKVFNNLRNQESGRMLFFDPEVELDDKKLALSVGMQMMENQVQSGKEPDSKFFARIGRRLATLGFDSGTVYSVLRELENSVERKEYE